jgi:lipoyl(octanoyl) transferase
MIQYLYLGRVAYDEALRLQDEMVALRQQNRIANLLLLLEHPPVLTLGRNAKRANVLASDELLARRGVTLHEINRGGDVTYHGPGQLIGYPIFDLRSLRNSRGSRMGPVDFVRQMEEALIRLCATYGVAAGRICGLTGVWCPAPGGSLDGCTVQTGGAPPPGTRKLVSIGIHVARGVTSHGFAFNINNDLRDFELINPCGIRGCRMTTLEQEADPRAETLPPLETLAHGVARQFGLVFNEEVLAVENLAALRAQASTQTEGEQSSGPVYPAQDTPLQIPPELERLHQNPAKGRPVRA